MNLAERYPNESGRGAFDLFLKPHLSRLLKAVGLDVVYERGEGDLLFLTGPSGKEESVLDLLGGYGASLMGHNHPELVDRATSLLASGRPFNVQASARSYAGLLAEKLAERLRQSTDHEYMVTFANTGAEAIEAAIKHAEYESMCRRDAILSDIESKMRRIRKALREGKCHLSESLYEQARAYLGYETIIDLHSLGFSILKFNHEKLVQQGIFLSLEGAFHGKTTGALQLTYNPEFRDPWKNIGISTKFLPFNDQIAAQEIIDSYTDYYVDVDITDTGEVTLTKKVFSRVTACFVEPIQGEGGIREIDRGYMQLLRDLATDYNFPLVVDEIQTMGRTGTFLATENIGIHGDYYTFSKALGGGLAKISALLVRKDRYMESFGYLHTSTFADDCFSSAIGLGVLELLEKDEDKLLTDCGRKGGFLKDQLGLVMQACPGVISSIRGRGLMLGVEFSHQKNNPSPLIRLLSEQSLLGFVISGFLLNEMNIRVAPTVSSHSVIRIEPSAYITQEQMDHCITAFRLVADIIRRGDSLRLCGFLAERKMMTLEATEVIQKYNQSSVEIDEQVSHRIAFIGHFLEPSDLASWDNNLYPLSTENCASLLDRTLGVMLPFTVKEHVLQSEVGTKVGVSVIGVPMTSEQFSVAMKNGETTEALKLIRDAVNIAKNKGAGIIGFGGYTSIITNNCTELVESSIGLTSGNSLTAAAAIEAIIQAATERGIDISTAKLGIVGAVGNIGKVLAEVMADEVGSITLITRSRGKKRLVRLVDEIYGHKLRKDLSISASGIDRSISSTNAFKSYDESCMTAKDFRQTLEAEIGESAPISVATEMDGLKSCDLIICATNSPDPIILPQHIGDKQVIVCDVATPNDVSKDVIVEKENAFVIEGGVIKLPGQQSMDVGGMDLEKGKVYACMAETIILGMTGMYSHFSYGPLIPAKVRQIRDLARIHGFSFDIQKAECR